MGEHRIEQAIDDRAIRAYTRAVLRDIQAVERMMQRGMIESAVRRIGVEQEMYLVDADGRPVASALRVLDALDDPRLTTEIAQFNLEANFDPHLLEADFLAILESELRETLERVDDAARTAGAHVLLTGILPTLRAEDLTVANMTPHPRYHNLNEALLRNHGPITIAIDGIEQYKGTHDSLVIEGANTSLQLHLQVDADNGADLYNLAQLISAPLVAAATNSPVLLGRRLWHETRVAVFERSVDARSVSQLARQVPTRATFGNDWVSSIADVFRDNAARFPVLLTRDPDPDPLAELDANRVPRLTALALHNGTVWRWNRPCYGVTDGQPHLRLECRVLPSGPTILDEVANAALFYGLMVGLPTGYGDVSERLSFACARDNFLASAQRGLDAEFTWLDNRRIGARRLLLDELIPAAAVGLASLGVSDEHCERYLGTVEERVRTRRTGAQWLLETFARRRNDAANTVWHDAVATMLDRQRSQKPVHQWSIAEPVGSRSGQHALTVGSIMTTDVFTVRPDDVIDLATSVMGWKHIRHIPVENASGELVGLLTARELLSLRGHRDAGTDDDPIAVAEAMQRDLVTVSPDTPVQDAIDTVLTTDSGCLLVTTRGKLLGIVTERDLLRALAGSRG